MLYLQAKHELQQQQQLIHGTILAPVIISLERIYTEFPRDHFQETVHIQ